VTRDLTSEDMFEDSEMSVIAVPAESESSWKTAWTRRFVSYATFSLCSTIYLFPFMRLLLQGTDEGLLVYGAVRIVHGQVFARDFFEIMGPGTFYWLAIFFKLFGVTFMAERICLFVTSIGTALAVYFLSRRICGRYRILPCILLAGTAFGPIWPTISHHVDSNFVALLSVACMTVWQDRRNDSLLSAAGALAGATTCFLQPKGVLLVFALVVWLWVQYRRRATPLSSLAFVAVGYISMVGLVLIYFCSQHALWDLIYANLLWPSRHYGAANVVPYALGLFRSYWDIWTAALGGAKWAAVVAAVPITPLIFVAVLPALILILGALRGRNSEKPEILLYGLCGWALWFAEVHRKDICHLVFGSPLLIVLCIHYLEEYRTKVADLALQILGISAACLACLNFALVLTAHPMATRVGSVAVFEIDPVLGAIDDKIAPGEEIFVYPYAPMYYFLSETTNPTRWSGLGYNYNAPSELQEVVRVLDQRRVRYVVWDTGLEERMLRLAFPSLKAARPDERIVEPYLESNYETVWVDAGIRIMRRKTEGSGHR
jgi:hypothetical protein